MQGGVNQQFLTFEACTISVWLADDGSFRVQQTPEGSIRVLRATHYNDRFSDHCFSVVTS